MLNCVSEDTRSQVAPLDSVTSNASIDRTRVINAMRSIYQADHQAEFLDLQAEADSLLQQLQKLKHKRSGAEEHENAEV
jgi:hypothetical protein